MFVKKDKRERGRFFFNNFKEIDLELGHFYMIYGKFCRFIKVTRKGFNFLNENTNKCILKHHLYDKRYRGKPLPKNINVIKTIVSMSCIKVEAQKEA